MYLSDPSGPNECVKKSALKDTHSGDGERHAKVFAPLQSEAPRRGSDQGHAVTAAHGGPVVRVCESV